MPEMIWGRIACRISRSWGNVGKYYCDHCRKFFDDRDKPPCELTAEQYIQDITARHKNKLVYNQAEIDNTPREPIVEEFTSLRKRRCVWCKNEILGQAWNSESWVGEWCSEECQRKHDEEREAQYRKRKGMGSSV